MVEIPNVAFRPKFYIKNADFFSFGTNGHAEYASKKLGRIVTQNTVSSLTNAIKVVKEDSISIGIQKEYFEKVKQ